VGVPFRSLSFPFFPFVPLPLPFALVVPFLSLSFPFVPFRSLASPVCAKMPPSKKSRTDTRKPMAQLKVLAGTARGRSLKTLPQNDLSIRPMLGRMKKSVFDIISNKIANSHFLDLYAGVGSVGIEAISRGAALAVFAELSPFSIALIKHNVDLLAFGDRAKIVRCDVINNFQNLLGSFDIIFCGPPYKDSEKKPLALTYPTLKNIAQYNVLRGGGIVIAQRHKKEEVPPVLGLTHFRDEQYGDTIISFYKRKD
jgi:16S rRNA (guanine(966)-N(2))-methyltransferase RsmD